MNEKELNNLREEWLKYYTTIVGAPLPLRLNAIADFWLSKLKDLQPKEEKCKYDDNCENCVGLGHDAAGFSCNECIPNPKKTYKNNEKLPSSDQKPSKEISGEWEKEFDEKFSHEYDEGFPNCGALLKVPGECNCQLKDIKSFISSLLKHRDEVLIEKVVTNMWKSSISLIKSMESSESFKEFHDDVIYLINKE